MTVYNAGSDEELIVLLRQGRDHVISSFFWTLAMMGIEPLVL